MGSTDLSGLNLLIVDDEDGLREVLVEYFAALGANTFEARNGREAIDLLKKQKIDSIISDVKMPEVDGRSLLKWVKTQDFGTQTFIFITGFSDLSESIAKQEGADQLLNKPFNMSDLEDALSKALKK